jgi:hypothetical protein
MVLDEKEVAMLVEGLNCLAAKWQGMVDIASEQSEVLREHTLTQMLREQIRAANALKDYVLDADTVAVI